MYVSWRKHRHTRLWSSLIGGRCHSHTAGLTLVKYHFLIHTAGCRWEPVFTDVGIKKTTQLVDIYTHRHTGQEGKRVVQWRSRVRGAQNIWWRVKKWGTKSNHACFNKVRNKSFKGTKPQQNKTVTKTGIPTLFNLWTVSYQLIYLL